jgi:cell division protein FtsI/penicillin-binding protein 2
MNDHSSIPSKANRVLYLALCAFLLIGARLWHLAIVQYEEKFEESKKPQRKAIVEAASRGTLRDRFNIPLAVNKAAYRASVAYFPIRQIPAIAWEADPQGKKTKVYRRKAYVRELSDLLAAELGLDPDRVVDLIYSKAALYSNIPYVLKEELSEREYYRLKMLEKDWPGLTVERDAKREYPKGRCACDLLGYMGSISRDEYENNMQEKRALETFLTEWESGENPDLPQGFQSPYEVRKRHKDLAELAYTASDSVGKAGIEALFEEQLRGFKGRRSYYSDSKGNILQELPGGRLPTPGKRILLTISQELQEFAEILLSQAEEIRHAKISVFGKGSKISKQPWIKGGSIIALEPHTGEVLALASYPRFDPNDFAATPQSSTAKMRKQNHINRWLENEAYIAALWNQQQPLQRERYNKALSSFYEEEKWLTWPFFLELLLPSNHPITLWFSEKGTIRNVVNILNEADRCEAQPITELLNEETPLSKELEFLPSTYNKLLFLDLCQLAVKHTAFSEPLLEKTGSQTIDTHREACCAYEQLKEAVKEIAKTLFHETVFKRWREQNEKKFLKDCREREKLAKTYAKPYIDYLDAKERELFARFWNQTCCDLCLALLNGAEEKEALRTFTQPLKQLHQELEAGAHPALTWRASYATLQKTILGLSASQAKEYLDSLRSYKDLTRPLKGKYPHLRIKNGPCLEKHLARGFYPYYGFGYGRSYAYRQSAAQGSIFKLVTAYEALMQANKSALSQGARPNDFNPLEVVDETFKNGKQTYVGYTSSGAAIPQNYKGGRLPRSYGGRKGKMNLQHAIETSSNVYFSLLAGDVLKSPQDLAKAAHLFGFGEKTGIELPGEIPGKVPEDLETNRTGLYAMAIGQHSLVVTPIQTALMLSAFANKGRLLKPHVIKALATVNENPEETNLDLPISPEQAPLLAAIGIDFPLFETPAFLRRPCVETTPSTIKKEIPMPDSFRQFLLQALHLVVVRAQSEGLWMLSKLYSDYPEAISDYIDLKNQIVGKTSTAEVRERIDFDEEEGVNLYTHLWFGGIAFEDDVAVSFDRPELVVIVYLRYGSYGKEAAPLAAQMVHKWREIKKKRS